MKDNSAAARAQHFAQHWQVWAALHHFLSAPLLREFLVVVVAEISCKSLTFDDLFEDSLGGSPHEMVSWLLRPRDRKDQLSGYLQRRIHLLVWKSDSPCGVPEKCDDARQIERANLLEIALGIGRLDFPNFARQNSMTEGDASERQASFAGFVSALATWGAKMSAATADAGLMTETLRMTFDSFDSLPKPLDALAAKHLADLSTDIDGWRAAAALYNQAAKRLKVSSEHWNEFRDSLNDILVQSQAAALRRLQGASAAQARLSSLKDAAVRQHPLLIANAAFDARVFFHESSEAFIPSPTYYQCAQLQSPLLLDSLDLATPLRHWLDGDRRQAHDAFWAVLRRQIALGSTTEARTTKALFARSIVDGLPDREAEQLTGEQFLLAVRLLIDSEDQRAAKAIKWHDTLVSYMDPTTCAALEQFARSYHAVENRRLRVLVQIFSGWCKLLPPEKADWARSMLIVLAAMSKDGHASRMTSHDLVAESLEALTEIAERRPEFRSAVAEDVTVAIVFKLTDPSFWSARSTAIETANAFADALSQTQLREIVASVLDVTDQLPGKSQNWLLVRGGLSLLISRPVKLLAAADSLLGRRILATILRFGEAEGAESPRVLFYLHDFDSALLRDRAVLDGLAGHVANLRARIRQFNSSAVSECILALLIAPELSGEDGVKDAIDALKRVLEAALQPRPVTVGLIQAYQPILQLALHREEMARELKLGLQTLDSWIRPLLPPIIRLWGRAADRPLLFAPFSLPPTERPNSTVVHNWVFATLALAAALNDSVDMETALNSAAKNPALTSAIILGKSTRSLQDTDQKPVDLSAIQTENRQTHYDNLGRRLSLLPRLPQKDQLTLCEVLLMQCFRHGPRPVDAAVILEAIRCSLADRIGSAASADYIQRLDNDRDAKLAVQPLLDPFISRA